MSSALDGAVDLRSQVGGLGGRLLFHEYAERVRKSMKWNIPSLAVLRNKWHRNALIICGGGPSIKRDLNKIRELQRRGGRVLTVNKTHDKFLDSEWLEKHSGDPSHIIPWAHTVLDPMPWVADYVKKPCPGTLYFVASSCDPVVLRRLRLQGALVFLWHAGADFYGTAMPGPILESEFPNKDWAVLAGPTTVGLRSVIIGYDLGFRPFHLFGFDSSKERDEAGVYRLHAYDKVAATDADEGTVTLNTAAGHWPFETNSHMSRQVLDFEDMCEQIGNNMKTRAWEPIDIRVYGDGLLPSYAASIGLHADPEKNKFYSGRKVA